MQINSFLNSFPGHVFRYLDTTGNKRSPIPSKEINKNLNEVNGYDAYFTVNGFSDYSKAVYENCTNLNAFFIDIDGRKDDQEIQNIKNTLQPSYIVETMRGYHVYWLLDEPVFKNELNSDEEWQKIQKKWLKIEAKIVKTFNADEKAQDIPRILRVPETYYWKNTNNDFLKGVIGSPFKTKIVHTNENARYSMRHFEEVFDVSFEEIVNSHITSEQQKKITEMERQDFFAIVDKEYPMDERDFFKQMISGKQGSIPGIENGRNNVLLITATLCKRAGWTLADTLMHFKTTGWHGIEKERGGDKEIENTIKSAFQRGYMYSMRHPVIAPLLSSKDNHMLATGEALAIKKRKQKDSVRFENYEHTFLAKYPYLKKNEAGIVFNYNNGVYKMLSDQELQSMFFRSMEEDVLYGYRTRKHVSDKIATLLAIIPNLEITNDGGYILNVKNGLLNILTKELKPHTPEYVSLSQSPVEYNKEAQAPTWQACLNAWTAGDDQENKKLLLQQYAGYCLSSTMKYAKMLFLVGDGGNGKSTFADTIKMIIGKQNTSSIDLGDLSKDFGLSGLIGKRLNVVEEVSGNFYQSHILKKIVSGEEVTINMKYKPQFNFTPSAKFIFAVNQMPRVDDSSMASERRILAVHFKNNFRLNANVNLRYSTGTLAKELPGILNWAVEGFSILEKNGGFIITEEQKEILKEYREENSSVEGFIAECLIDEQGAIVTLNELYNEYIKFCKEDGRKQKSKISFAKELKNYSDRTKRFQQITRKNGKDVSSFEGVKINEDWNSVTSFNQVIF